jgi:hypothetical protein
MLLAEIVKTCSHEEVAQAAIASMGTDFERLVERVAVERGMRTGSFVASTVRYFGRTAGNDEWAGLAKAMAGKDMPILSGLRHILEPALTDCAAARGRGAACSRLNNRAASVPAAYLGCEA